MSTVAAGVVCDGCGREVKSDVLSTAELRHNLMAERGWVTEPRLGADACDRSECRDHVAGMVR